MILLLVSFTAQAQEKKNKNAKYHIEVNGNCEMCKKRIEKAAFSVSGAFFAASAASFSTTTAPASLAWIFSTGNGVPPMGGINIVISNAGIVRPTQPTRDSYERAIQDFDDVINVNLRGVFLTGRAAIPHMLATGGDIVNITTDHIHTCGWPELLDHTHAQECPWKDVQRPPVGSKNFDIYDSSKWGIKGITNAWARDLAPHKIRVNSFGMGATITPMFLSVLGDRPLPSGTMQADDVAGLIVELIAEGPDGRTGDDVQVWAGHPTALPPSDSKAASP